VTQTVKLRSIIKQYNEKAFKKVQQAAMKGHITTLITQTEDISDTQSHFNSVTLQAIPAVDTKSTRAKNSRHQFFYQASRVQLQDIQKTHNSK